MIEKSPVKKFFTSLPTQLFGVYVSPNKIIFTDGLVILYNFTLLLSSLEQTLITHTQVQVVPPFEQTLIIHIQGLFVCNISKNSVEYF